MARALTTRRHARAILATLRRVILPSWLGLLLFVFLNVVSRGASFEAVQTMLVFWFLIGFIAAFVALARANSVLRDEFRQAASADHSETKRAERAGSAQGWRPANA